MFQRKHLLVNDEDLDELETFVYDELDDEDVLGDDLPDYLK